MPVVDLAVLTAPVSDEAPCGFDLEAAGDLEFMNFMARAEGLLPASYFSGPNGEPFDRSQIDLAAEFKAAAPFLAQTRDVRLLALLAKFAVLTRSADDFVNCVRSIADLLENRWDDVHPRAEGGDFASRMAALETLDDTAPVVLPLQHLPLIQSRRSGSVSYRHVMFANGDAQPREGEEAHDRAAIDRALAEVDMDELLARRDQIDALRDALAAIEKACGAKVKLPKVTALATGIFNLLNDAVALRDPSAAMAAEADAAAPDAPAVKAGPIRSRDEATTALAAVEAYFCRSEPSNPALLLVRQAQQLVGKSFLEAMQVLVPGRVPEAKFRIGQDGLVEIPVEALSSFSVVEGGWGYAEPPAPADDAPTDGEAPADGDAPADSEASTDGDAPTNGGAMASRVAVEAPAGPPRAGSRAEAFALLEQIALYYRNAEPSSPIASLAERARGFANRDFLTLLKDLLPTASPG